MNKEDLFKDQIGKYLVSARFKSNNQLELMFSKSMDKAVECTKITITLYAEDNNLFGEQPRVGFRPGPILNC